MKYNNVEFDTYFKTYPDENGYFGKYGGAYIPDELKKAMEEKNLPGTVIYFGCPGEYADIINKYVK